MENTEKQKGMYLKDVLKKLKISRTTFYTHHADGLTVTKDASGYRNIYLLEEVEKLAHKLQPIEIVKE